MSYKLEKMPNGKYKIRVWSKPDEFGKIKTKQVSNINTVAVAKKKALEIEEALDNDCTIKAYTFKQLFNLYFEAKKKKLSPNTLNSKKNYRETTLQYWGNVPADKITTRNVQKWINELEEKENPNKKGIRIKSATVKEYYKVLNTILNWAAEQNLIEFNRIKTIEFLDDDEEFEPTILSPEKLNEILMAFKKNCYNLYIPSLISLLNDPRRGEVTALKYSDIDFDKGLIYLRSAAYQEEGKKKTKNKLKTKSSKRILVMSDFLKQELLEHKELNKALNSDFVCDNIFIGELTPSYISHKFHDFVKQRFGIDMRFHDLRHNFNQLCYENGTDSTTRSKMMGHSSEKITNKVYTHFSTSKAKEAVESVSESLNFSSNKK